MSFLFVYVVGLRVYVRSNAPFVKRYIYYICYIDDVDCGVIYGLVIILRLLADELRKMILIFNMGHHAAEVLEAALLIKIDENETLRQMAKAAEGGNVSA